MIFLTRVIAGAIALACPIAGAAQDWNNTATIGAGWGDISDGGGDVVSYTFDLSGSVAFDSGFRVGYDLGFVSADFDDLGFDASATSVVLAPRYRFSGKPVTIGAYLDHGILDISGLGTDLEATSYGLTAGYETDTWRATAFYGITETDPDLPAGVDVTDAGLQLGFVASDRVTLAGNYVKTMVDVPGGSIDADLVELAATYAVTSNIGLFGGISHATVSGFGFSGDFNTYGIGASYFLGDHVGLPITMSLEAARSELVLLGTSAEMDTIRLGLTVPLGGGGAKLPLNSAAGAIQNGRHSAVTSAILTGF